MALKETSLDLRLTCYELCTKLADAEVELLKRTKLTKKLQARLSDSESELKRLRKTNNLLIKTREQLQHDEYYMLKNENKELERKLRTLRASQLTLAAKLEAQSDVRTKKYLALDRLYKVKISKLNDDKKSLKVENAEYKEKLASWQATERGYVSLTRHRHHTNILRKKLSGVRRELRLAKSKKNPKSAHPNKKHKNEHVNKPHPEPTILPPLKEFESMADPSRPKPTAKTTLVRRMRDVAKNLKTIGGESGMDAEDHHQVLISGWKALLAATALRHNDIMRYILIKLQIETYIRNEQYSIWAILNDNRNPWGFATPPKRVVDSNCPPPPPPPPPAAASSELGNSAVAEPQHHNGHSAYSHSDSVSEIEIGDVILSDSDSDSDVMVVDVSDTGSQKRMDELTLGDDSRHKKARKLNETVGK